MVPEINIRGSILQAIPAIHYRSVFAAKVNAVCRHKLKRPEAIAVELGPGVTSELTSWLRELGCGKSKGILLPNMLGLLIKNRLIHPQYRRTALFLQEYYRMSLNEMPASIRNKFLNFSDRYMVSLCSTDSIIEAIRCGIELDIPVFGIDLDEFASGQEKDSQIEEPKASAFNLSQYVSRNEKIAALARDPYIDQRREIVMAARLKYLMDHYKHVLFTGGLAHWTQITTLMQDSFVKPADISNTGNPKLNIERVIIHPGMSLRFSDNFPVMSTIYEQNRQIAGISGHQEVKLPDYQIIYREIIQKATETFFGNDDGVTGEIKEAVESSHLPDLDRILSNLRLIGQRSAPSISEILEVAGGIMPEKFCKCLTKAVMDIRREWASSLQFPDLRVITPANGEGIETGTYHLIKTEQDGENRHVITDKEKINIKANNSEQSSENKINHWWKWTDEPKKRKDKIHFCPWIWPPCEALLYGTAARAAKITNVRVMEKESTIFEGSIGDGPDLKSTIRSIIRGENRIYVKTASFRKRPHIPDGKRPDPSVFIFSGEETAEPPHWSLLFAGSSVGDHVSDKARFREFCSYRGSAFVSTITLEQSRSVPLNLVSSVNSMSRLDGITIFGNPCINAIQGAKWLEDNDFTCCPVLSSHFSGGFESLIAYYEANHRLSISPEDWQTALILFALPYAHEQVVIIAPEHYKPSNILYKEAHQRNISLSLVPQSFFPAEKIDEMRNRYAVMPMDKDGSTFSPEVEKALGQQSNHYYNMLPLYMQKQLKPNY